MRLYKFISIILHPIVSPTIGVIIYLIFLPHTIIEKQRLYLIGYIFIITYLIPLGVLILLKGLNLINSFKVQSIKERKIPLFLMILLFTIIGNIFMKSLNLRDFGVLFYGTTLGLILVYLFIIFQIKVSLHLLSIGSLIGFFMMMGFEYSTSVAPIILVLILLSGLLASARLHLKAHEPKEVYLGVLFGISSQICAYCIL